MQSAAAKEAKVKDTEKKRHEVKADTKKDLEQAAEGKERAAAHEEEEQSAKGKLWAKACEDQEAEEAAQAKCRFDANKKTHNEDLQKTREEVEEQKAKTKFRFKAYKKTRDKKREKEEEKTAKEAAQVKLRFINYIHYIARGRHKHNVAIRAFN